MGLPCGATVCCLSEFAAFCWPSSANAWRVAAGAINPPLRLLNLPGLLLADDFGGGF